MPRIVRFTFVPPIERHPFAGRREEELPFLAEIVTGRSPVQVVVQVHVSALLDALDHTVQLCMIVDRHQKHAAGSTVMRRLIPVDLYER